MKQPTADYSNEHNNKGGKDMRSVFIWMCGVFVGLAWATGLTATAERTAVWHPQSGDVITVSWANQVCYRIEELERKVAGMQKQITILHAKKADK